MPGAGRAKTPWVTRAEYEKLPAGDACGLLLFYFIGLSVFVVAAVVLFILYMSLPYASTPEIIGLGNTYLVINCIITGVAIVLSFIYLGIPYKRAKAYFRLLDDFKVGQKVKNTGTFLQNDISITEINGVEFYSMIVLEWSEKTQTFMRRHVLVDKEKPLPELKNGDIINYVTHANVLLVYVLKSEDEIFDDILN